MKKVFILKSENLETGEIENLSNCAYKDYHYAVDVLKQYLINSRHKLAKEQGFIEVREDEDGYEIESIKKDMTEVLKGFIEVYETKKGQYSETYNKEPIKTYKYGF